MNIQKMTIGQFRGLPCREWGGDIGEFDALIILPDDIEKWSLLIYKIKRILGKVAPKWFKFPDANDVKGLHDSGYRLLDFVACKGDKPICRLSGCSDVININGIGGYGNSWLEKFKKVPKMIIPIGWSIDCLPKSGLLRLFCEKKLIAGNALGTFEVFALDSCHIEDLTVKDVWR